MTNGLEINVELVEADEKFKKVKEQLAKNVAAALRVSYGEQDGKLLKGSKAHVMRETGLSRTTLLALTDTSSTRSVDLATLTQVAEYLQIPPAFLLMSAEDWKLLLDCFHELPHLMEAANKAIPQTALLNPRLGVDVLGVLNMHPDYAPHVETTHPRFDAERIERNQKRARRSHILSAIAQPSARGDNRRLKDLTALAAGLAYFLTNQPN